MTRALYVVPEHEFEAVPGLPEPLPAGEEIRWQGAPRWQTLAIEAFHVRKLSIYFAVILLLRVVLVMGDGSNAIDAVLSALFLLPLAAIAIGLLSLLAWLTARTTLYTITNERLIMRIGIVLSVTFNLPFRSLDHAGMKIFANGAGDIAIAIGTDDRIAYAHLWPHARPWRFARPEPMLRSIPDVNHVAAILSNSMAQASGGIASIAATGVSHSSTKPAVAQNWAVAS